MLSSVAFVFTPSVHSLRTDVTLVGNLKASDWSEELSMSNPCFGRTDQCAFFCYTSDMYDIDGMLLGSEFHTEVMEMFDHAIDSCLPQPQMNIGLAGDGALVLLRQQPARYVASPQHHDGCLLSAQFTDASPP